jgi:hypothetical protein
VPPTLSASFFREATPVVSLRSSSSTTLHARAYAPSPFWYDIDFPAAEDPREIPLPPPERAARASSNAMFRNTVGIQFQRRDFKLSGLRSSFEGIKFCSLLIPHGIIMLLVFVLRYFISKL